MVVFLGVLVETFVGGDLKRRSFHWREDHLSMHLLMFAAVVYAGKWRPGTVFGNPRPQKD